MPDSVSTPLAAPSLKGEVTIVEPDRFERAVARRGAETRATVPSVDYQAVVQIDQSLEYAAAHECGITAVVVAAVAQALRTHPRVNAAYRDGHYELYSRVNVGVTLIDDGLYATPTIFDADSKTASQIAEELDAYRERAQVSELHASEVAGATFTLLDGTGFQVTSTAPLVAAPQAAALALGAVREAPVVRAGELVAGHTLTLSLAVDHRIVYGATALEFLDQITASLEGPAR